MPNNDTKTAVADVEVTTFSQENTSIQIEQVSADDLPMFRVLLQNEYQG